MTLEYALKLFAITLYSLAVVAIMWAGILALTHYFPVHFACYYTGNTPPPELLKEGN